MKNIFTALTGYVFDEKLLKDENAKKQNYWYKYIEEIFDELGLRASKISLDMLGDVNTLSNFRVVILGDFEITEIAKKNLEKWISRGGIVVGFATHGADSIFGINSKASLKQPDDAFTVSSYCKVRENWSEEKIPVNEFSNMFLPVISSVELVKNSDSEVMADLRSAAFFAETEYPLITRKKLGSGRAYYFAFNLPQTIWVLHQGRPVDKDYDGDGIYRTFDAIVIPRMLDVQIPYADKWLTLLQSILALVPQPFVFQLPPIEDGKVPDLLLHYGGDDECSPNLQIPASDRMKEKGLPYHINLMARNGKFAIDKKDYDHIKANGHELSIHFDFVKPHNHFKQHELVAQLEEYKNAFGEIPIASVNHVFTATGWAEQARWASAEGCKGDNSRAHTFIPPMNPINTLGFGFGTAFPHFVFDDFEHDNVKIPYTYIPVIFYEARIYDDSRDVDTEKVHFAIDSAATHSWTMNMFFHPHYISGDKACNEAIDETLRYIKEKGYEVVHTGTDGVCLWWFDRSKTVVEYITVEETVEEAGNAIRFKVDTGSKNGVLLKVPLPDSYNGNGSYHLDGVNRKGTIKNLCGICWLLSFIPQGKHEVGFDII